MKHCYHWSIKDVKNNWFTSDFYAPTALLSLDAIVKHMQEDTNNADVITPNTVYKVIIYEDGWLFTSFYFHSDEKGDVFHGREQVDNHRRRAVKQQYKKGKYQMNKYHCAVIDMISEKTVLEFDATTLKGLTLDAVVERMKANGTDVKINWGYKLLVYKNGDYYGALYMRMHKNGGIFTMPL